MSEGGFHVHGPHDHELEHATHSQDPFAGRIAVMTAIFATIGAMMGYMAGATQNDALLYKNEAAISKTEASDQWNFYQAKSGKQNIAELGTVLTAGDVQAKFATEAERYRKEKDDIMVEAKKLEAAAAAAEAKSEASMHVHHRWAQAMMLIQIGIALGAIALLTRSKPMSIGAIAVAVASVALGALALAHI